MLDNPGDELYLTSHLAIYSLMAYNAGGRSRIFMGVRLISVVIIMLTAVAAGQCVLAQEQGQAQWVARRADERDTGRDASLEMEMTLVNKKGIERQRRLVIVRKDFAGCDKLLLKFTYPHDIEGTAFLVWEHKDDDNERFLYLPEIGRVRRIASREKDENFAGTDFSYEDISGRRLADYTYKIVRESYTYNGHECYVLGSYAREKNPRFPKIISLVRRDNFVPIKAGYYNSNGKLEKNYEVRSLKQVDGVWTPLEMVMENTVTGHTTTIVVKQVRYNQGLADELFTRSELKR